MHHVAILHDVLFAFQPQLAFGASVGFRARVQQRVPVDGFRANEMLFQIRVDCAGGVLRARSARHGPGAALVFTDGEE